MRIWRIWCEGGCRWGLTPILVMVMALAIIPSQRAGAAETDAAAGNAKIEPAQVQAQQLETSRAPTDPDKMVCKRVRQTGTHFKRRVCHKQHVWDEWQRDAQDALRDATSGRVSNTGS